MIYKGNEINNCLDKSQKIVNHDKKRKDDERNTNMNSIVKMKSAGLTSIYIPTELLDQVGIKADSTLECFVDNGMLMIQAIKPEKFICDKKCPECPFYNERNSNCEIE